MTEHKPRLTAKVLRGFLELQLFFDRQQWYKGRRRPDTDVQRALKWAQQMRGYRARKKEKS